MSRKLASEAWAAYEANIGKLKASIKGTFPILVPSVPSK